MGAACLLLRPPENCWSDGRGGWWEVWAAKGMWAAQSTSCEAEVMIDAL